MSATNRNKHKAEQKDNISINHNKSNAPKSEKTGVDSDKPSANYSDGPMYDEIQKQMEMIKERRKAFTKTKKILKKTHNILSKSVQQLDTFYKETENSQNTKMDTAEFTKILKEATQLLEKCRDINVNDINAALTKIKIKNKNEDRKEEQKSAPSAPPIKLYCALCVKSYRLKWPLNIGKITRNPNSYKEELKRWINEKGGKYDRESSESKNKKFGTIDGELLHLKCTNNCICTKCKNRCGHIAGFGNVFCQHCGAEVTEVFDPRMRKCPKCNEKLHGAISSKRGIKVH